LHELQKRFGDYLGEIATIGAKFSYPLILRIAERRTDRRFFMVGDSAHAIHPMAGQGFNLGVRDIAVLAELVAGARDVGLDFADENVAQAYEKSRNFDIYSLAAFTTGMNALFTNDNPILSAARGAGLALVNALPKVRNFFMRQAVRGGSDLPKLLRGEPLGFQ
jgi:2-octaprenyl-6-methoxyphenol hydroxylase